MDSYTELANAIIIQAVKDYRKALKTLNRHPRYEPARAMVTEVEDFFRSEWYRTLTSVDAEMLMRKIRREINDCA